MSCTEEPGAGRAGIHFERTVSMIMDALMDAALDTIKLLPFLYITYIVMEYLEGMTEEKTTVWLKKAGRLGPVIGGISGILPQCGFSAAASGLFTGGVISMGTLLAVFLSTSDEMLPIFISEAVSPVIILQILGLKALLGIITGTVIDLLFRNEQARMRERYHRFREDEDEFHHHDEEHSRGLKNIMLSALQHTVQITLFIFLTTFVITLLVEAIGEDAMAVFLSGKPVIGVFLAGIVGLIPNCAASVTITTLYLRGFLTLGQLLAGLLVGAGVGLLVLFRGHADMKENLKITALLYGAGVFWGLMTTLFIPG